MRPLGPGDPEAVGPYPLLGRIGDGGMGRVYLARSPAGRFVAVKVVHTDLADDPFFRDRFRHEVAAARRVSGAFTAPVIDADPDAPVPWLATLYVPGPSLAEVVETTGPLPVGACLRLGAGMLEAVVSIHRAGIAHRDIKPSNVLLAADGPRLIDFGIARAADRTALTRYGDVFGTPAFMSPEQAAGADAGTASDVFSLAAVLVFAATGTGPFGDGDPPALLYRVVHHEPDLAALPAELAALARPCLAKDPADRPAPAALLAAFAARLADAGPLAWPAPVARLVGQREDELRAEPPLAATLPDPSVPGAVLVTAQPAVSPPVARHPARVGPAPLARTRVEPPEDGAYVFTGQRWPHLLTGNLVLLLVAVCVLTMLNALRYLGEDTPASTPRGAIAVAMLAFGCAMVALTTWRRGLWRLRLGISPPRLVIGPGGIQAQAGGRHYSVPWSQLGGAQVIRLGRQDVVAVWPGPEWVLRTPHVDRHPWWMPRTPLRCIWRHPGRGCDVLLDIRLLHPTPAHQVSTALAVQAARYAPRRPS
ncbi:MAG: serine/threonine protein kinase [Frankia sp.]|nr:serine/threonine protein kinase [Frankia sp.]